MRDIAEKMGVEVHGSLWVINELIAKELITDEKALTLIEGLRKTNDWLPKNEVEKMIIILKQRNNSEL